MSFLLGLWEGTLKRNESGITVPTKVEFDHGSEAKGRVRTYFLAAAAGKFGTAVLAVDLAEDEAPPEGLEHNFRAHSTAFIHPW